MSESERERPVIGVSDSVRKPGEDNPRGYNEDERGKALYKHGEDVDCELYRNRA